MCSAYNTHWLQHKTIHGKRGWINAFWWNQAPCWPRSHKKWDDLNGSAFLVFSRWSWGFSFDWYTKSRILGVKKTALSKVRSLKLSRNCFGSVWANQLGLPTEVLRSHSCQRRQIIVPEEDRSTSARFNACFSSSIVATNSPKRLAKECLQVWKSRSIKLELQLRNTLLSFNWVISSLFWKTLSHS